MSLFTIPDEGPFVFGAYAAHVNQSTPTPGPADPDELQVAAEETPLEDASTTGPL